MKTIIYRLACAILMFRIMALSVSAQEKTSFVNKVLDWIDHPYEYLDPLYVSQPDTKLMFTLTNNLAQTGVRVFDDRYFLSENLDIEYTTYTRMQLKDRVYHKTGLRATYRRISVGGGMETGRKNKKNATFSFNWNTPYYGLNASYNHIHEYGKGTIDVDYRWDQDHTVTQLEQESEYPGDLKEILLDGYFAFNRHKFAYTAVYRGNVIQRRSAGSWMLGIKYLYGDVKFDTRDIELLSFLSGITGCRTHQFSLGGGYSYNLVAFHRDETGKHLKGLRNLTFNATVIPMITPVNPLIVKHENEETNKLFGYEGGNIVRHSRPALNYTARAGMSLSINRFSFLAKAQYDNFRFNTGRKTEQLHVASDFDNPVEINKMRGRLFNWTVSMELQFKF